MPSTYSTIDPTSSSWPQGLVDMGKDAPDYLHVMGKPDLLAEPLTALFCSVKCPGNVILKTYELARHLKDTETPVIGGFHSPMERECLDIFLTGKQRVVVCAARALPVRLSAQWRRAVDEGRLTLISPFDAKLRRQSQATCQYRNLVVAALAERILITYASPGGHAEDLCRDFLARNKDVITVADNKQLLKLGAEPFKPG
ncbi:MAG: DNA-processing protein DprA [Planctomycetota bacterium]|nr:DNA-processing protein DprA [Planctomycetota bacterium]